jgi:hypothetical protein
VKLLKGRLGSSETASAGATVCDPSGDVAAASEHRVLRGAQRHGNLRFELVAGSMLGSAHARRLLHVDLGSRECAPVHSRTPPVDAPLQRRTKAGCRSRSRSKHPVSALPIARIRARIAHNIVQGVPHCVTLRGNPEIHRASACASRMPRLTQSDFRSSIRTARVNIRTHQCPSKSRHSRSDILLDEHGEDR